MGEERRTYLQQFAESLSAADRIPITEVINY